MSNSENPNDRNKRDEYNLSENSRLAGIDFVYSNKIASKIYAKMKVLEKDSCQSDTYSRLKKVLYQAVRNDQVHELGQLQLGFGDLRSLKGFRFSKKTSWNTFFMNNPTAKFDQEKARVGLAIPTIYAREFNRFPEKTSKAVLRFHCIYVSLNGECIIESRSSKELVVRDGVNSRSVYFPIKETSTILILCIGSVHTWLFSNNLESEFLSRNNLFMTAEIFDALLIQDGKLCHFEENKLPDINPPEYPDANDDLDWE